MANAHIPTESVVMYSDKWLTDLIWGSNIGWSCGTILTLWPGHSKPLSLKVCAHGMSRMFLSCFLLCLGLLRSLGSPLSSRLVQHSWDVSTSFSEYFLLGQVLKIVPSWNSCSGAAFASLSEQVPVLPQCPLCDGQSPLPQFLSDHWDTCCYGPLVIPQLLCCCVAGW